jgi:co-chaperonin GroES (HSP10)
MFLVLPIFKIFLIFHLGIIRILNAIGEIRRKRYLKVLLNEQRVLIRRRELNLSLDGIKVNDRSLEMADRHIRSYYFSGIPQNISRENIYKVLDNKLEYIFSLHISQSNRSEMIKLARQRISVLESINEEREQKGKLRKIEHDKEIEELNSFIEIILEEVMIGGWVGTEVKVDGMVVLIIRIDDVAAVVE